MELSSVDLNLLVVFEAVMKERSVTRAAHAIGLSQPAVSSALNRFRHLVGDPLLIRTNGTMLPTPRAESLIGPISEALNTVRHSLTEQPSFDPATVRRNFRLLLTDIGETVYLPPLVEYAARAGSGITFQVAPCDPDADAERLRRGEADLAIGTLPYLKHRLEQEHLFYGSFACMVCADHPTIGETITMEEFVAAEHLVVAPGNGSDGIVEKTLNTLGVVRKVALTVPHFLAVPSIVARTRLLVTVPERLGHMLTRGGETRLVRLPFTMRPIEIRYYWHIRHQADAGNAWLREAVRRLFHDASEYEAATTVIDGSEGSSTAPNRCRNVRRRQLSAASDAT